MNIDPRFINHLADPEVVIGIATNLYTIASKKEVRQKQLNYSDSLMNKLYAVGWQNFEKGRFKEALELFSNLFMLNPLDYRICYAAAASAQNLQEWYRAIVYYAFAAAAAKQAPEPVYFIAECCLQLGKDKTAAKMYGKTAAICANRADFKELKERCQVLQQGLEKRIQEGKAPLCLEAQSAPVASS